MQYLATGGYIVGKMAQLIYYGGIDLSAIKDWDLAVSRTNELIRTNKDVIIYEATFYANNKLVRVDILEKIGSELRVIEVKAKSQASEEENDRIPSEYLDDVLFQVLTVEEAFPNLNVKGYLFLPDKSKVNKIEGLAGWFTIEEITSEVYELDELPGRTTSFTIPSVRFKYEDDPDKQKYIEQLREDSILELRDIRDRDFDGDWTAAKQEVKTSFERLYDSVQNGRAGSISKNCKDCEYASEIEGKNGFAECWKDFAGQDLSAFDLYYGGSLKHQGAPYLNYLIEAKTMSLKDIDLDALLMSMGLL